MKKFIALLSALTLMVMPNLLVAQDVNVTPGMIEGLEQGCNSNNGKYCATLGLLYFNGIKQDYSKAVKYFTKACILNYGMGCVNLGNAYFNLDKQKAKKYFGLACYLKEQTGCEWYKLMNEMGIN